MINDPTRRAEHGGPNPPGEAGAGTTNTRGSTSTRKTVGAPMSSASSLMSQSSTPCRRAGKEAVPWLSAMSSETVDNPPYPYATRFAVVEHARHELRRSLHRKSHLGPMRRSAGQRHFPERAATAPEKSWCGLAQYAIGGRLWTSTRDALHAAAAPRWTPTTTKWRESLGDWDPAAAPTATQPPARCGFDDLTSMRRTSPPPSRRRPRRHLLDRGDEI